MANLFQRSAYNPIIATHTRQQTFFFSLKATGLFIVPFEEADLSLCFNNVYQGVYYKLEFVYACIRGVEIVVFINGIIMTLEFLMLLFDLHG